MSQRNTFKAALRFEQAKTNNQLVQDSVVSDSLGWSLNIQDSSKVTIRKTAFVNSRQFGVNIMESNNVLLEEVLVADVRKREDLKIQPGQTMDREACVAICSYLDKNDKDCENVKVKSSIAAGCPYAAFITPAHNCDQPNENFKNNVAHSVDGHKGGVGVIFFRNKHQNENCWEGSYVSAYKIKGAGVSAHFGESKESEVRMSNLINVDNLNGISVMSVGSGDKVKSMLQNSVFWGEQAELADDCPENHDCFCPWMKTGMMLMSSNNAGKPNHETMQAMMPHWKITKYGAFGGDAEMKNNKFIGFKAATKCGSKQAIFSL